MASLIKHKQCQYINNFKFIQRHCHYDLSKFNFTNQVIPHIA